MENIVAIISDNETNIRKIIMDGFGAGKPFHCFDYTLNLVPSRIIEKVEIVVNFAKKLNYNSIFQKICRYGSIARSIKFKTYSKC